MNAIYGVYGPQVMKVEPTSVLTGFYRNCNLSNMNGQEYSHLREAIQMHKNCYLLI